MPAKQHDSQRELVQEIFRRLDTRQINTAQIAARIGVAPPRVSEWRHGSHLPAEATIKALAEMIGTRPTYGLARIKS